MHARRTVAVVSGLVLAVSVCLAAFARPLWSVDTGSWDHCSRAAARQSRSASGRLLARRPFAATSLALCFASFAHDCHTVAASIVRLHSAAARCQRRRTTRLHTLRRAQPSDASHCCCRSTPPPRVTRRCTTHMNHSQMQRQDTPIITQPCTHSSSIIHSIHSSRTSRSDCTCTRRRRRIRSRSRTRARRPTRNRWPNYDSTRRRQHTTQQRSITMQQRRHTHISIRRPLERRHQRPCPPSRRMLHFTARTAPQQQQRNNGLRTEQRQQQQAHHRRVRRAPPPQPRRTRSARPTCCCSAFAPRRTVCAV